jgi:hypothetical protein
MSDPKNIAEKTKKAVDQKKVALDNVTAAMKAAYSSGSTALINYIKLGKALMDARNELGSMFYAVIHDDVMPRKSVIRYIRLVAYENSYDILSKKPNDNDKIIADKRVMELLEEDSDISALKDASMTKLTKMKGLSSKDFDKVINGDDTPLEGTTGGGDVASERRTIKIKLKDLFDDEYANKMMASKINEALLELCKVQEVVKEKDNKITDLEVEIQRLNTEATLRRNTMIDVGIVKGGLANNEYALSSTRN